LLPQKRGLVRLQGLSLGEAPEWRSHQYEYFTLANAKKLDMDSFGLLCKWLFFKDKTLQQWDYASIKVHTAFIDKNSRGFEDLQFNKHSFDDLILQLAENLVETDNSRCPPSKVHESWCRARRGRGETKRLRKGRGELKKQRTSREWAGCRAAHYNGTMEDQLFGVSLPSYSYIVPRFVLRPC
jgi:hypothetical protein